MASYWRHSMEQYSEVCEESSGQCAYHQSGDVARIYRVCRNRFVANRAPIQITHFVSFIFVYMSSTVKKGGPCFCLWFLYILFSILAEKISGNERDIETVSSSQSQCRKIPSCIILAFPLPPFLPWHARANFAHAWRRHCLSRYAALDNGQRRRESVQRRW